MTRPSLEKKFLSFLTGKKNLLILEFLCGAITAGLLVQAFHKAYRPGGYDFTPQLEAAKALVNGQNPYIPFNSSSFQYIYPLFFCILVIPLTWLPYWLSNLLWFVFSAACLWFSLRVLLELYPPKLPKNEWRALFGFSFLLLLNIVQNNFVNGQMDFFILALCVFSFRFLMERKPILSGWLLATAISVKLIPLILVAYLLFKKEWKALFWAVMGTWVLILGLPWLIAGPSVVQYYHDYLSGQILPSLGAGAKPTSDVFQLKSYLHLLAPFLNGIVLSMVSALLALAPLAFLQVRFSPSASLRVQTLLFSAYMALSLWLSPMSETHHLAALFPAVFILARYFVWEKSGPLFRRLLPVAWVIALLWLGKLSFVFYFLAIGTCYVLLCYWIWREGWEKPKGKRAS